MRKFFTFLFSVLLVSTLFAQKPEVMLKKADVAPVVGGGEIDAIWEGVEQNNISVPFQSEASSVGAEGETWWKGLWTDDGIYLLVNVADDDWYPWYEASGTNGWQYDKPELYFDANYVKDDGLGGHNPGQSGNYQIAPDPTADNTDGEMNDDFKNDDGIAVQYAFFVDDDPHWMAEYFVPFAWLKTGDGGGVDIAGEIGFDITIIDNDAPGGDNDRQRVNWSNAGALDESWNNMDDAGLITLEGAEVVYVTDITISADGDITEDNQTVKINAVVEPEDATDKTVKWVIQPESTARATINADGVVTPIADGTLVVIGWSSDDFIESNPVTINISGQITTRFEVSYIKNGDFNVFNPETLAPGAPWTGGSTVVDGVLNITNTNDPDTTGIDPWDWTVGQNVKIPEELKNDPFILQLKMWISEPDTFDVDLELIGDDYLRFGNTPDPRSGDGRSQWRFELTTEPTMYTIDITDFSGMDTRAQKFNLFAGLTNNTVYIDSVTLVSKADLENVVTSAKPVMSLETLLVYPNPANDKLHVNLTSANSRVIIYNSVGMIMEEAEVVGNHHIFDVSRYTPGMYFVKANNSVAKFLK